MLCWVAICSVSLNLVSSCLILLCWVSWRHDFTTKFRLGWKYLSEWMNSSPFVSAAVNYTPEKFYGIGCRSQIQIHVKKIHQEQRDVSPGTHSTAKNTEKGGKLKVYKCNICSKTFPSSSHLTRHIRDHCYKTSFIIALKWIMCLSMISFFKLV